MLSLLTIPTSPVQAQNVNQWDVTVYLSTTGAQVKSSNASETIDVDTEFGYTCIPGRTLHPENQPGTDVPTRALVLTGDGKLSGIDEDSGSSDRPLEKSSCTGSVNGKVDLERGSITYTGESDQVVDISAGPTAGQYEHRVTFNGAASFPASAQHQPPSGAVPGTFDYTYHSSCIHCSDPFDETFSGSMPLTLYFWPSTLGPWAQLDRSEAARFSAIQLTGGGFTPGAILKIMIGNRVFSRITAQPVTGAIPENTWIWVPDDIPFGPNKVWIEQEDSEIKSNLIDLNVLKITRQALVKNFDEVVTQYQETIPANANWTAWLESQGIKSLEKDGQPTGAGLLWAPSAVMLLGQNQDQLWPDNTYTSSWYQAEVLEFLRAMRFDPDPARRALLDGLDFGPFNSGVSQLPAGAHFFVVVWPHGPALDPQLEHKLAPTWDNAGVSFDPWPRQSPDIFEIKKDSAAWAADSAYKDHFKPPQYNYFLARPEPAMWGYNTGDYPTTGGAYYSLTPKGARAFNPAQRVGTGGDPPMLLGVDGPVTLAIKDSQGHKAVTKSNGSLVNAIPNSAVLVAPKTTPDNAWYLILPQDRFDMILTGAGPGEFRLRTKLPGKPIQVFPPVLVNKGEKATLSFNDQDQPPTLHTAAGKDLSPTSQELASPPPMPTRQPLPSPTAPVSATPLPASTTAPPQTTPDISRILILLGGLVGVPVLVIVLAVEISVLLRWRKGVR